MKWMLLLTVSVLTLAWTETGSAQEKQTQECRFDVECLDTDGCAETNFELTLSYELKPVGPKGMISKAEKSDVNGVNAGLISVRNGVTRFTTGEFFEGMEETLTVNSDGAARYVVTLPDIPMVITYAGVCEVME